MTRSRQKTLYKKGDDKEQRQDNAPDPPGHGRPKKPQRRVGKKLKEKNAGGHQDGAREKETSAKNERDAVLRALKTNQGYRGEDKSQKGASPITCSYLSWAAVTCPEEPGHL